MKSDIETFIDRWSPSGGAERSNYALFLTELCDVIDVPHPEPTLAEDDSQNAYVFERNVVFDNRDGSTSTKRIDLYKRGCFVLETKQGVQNQDETTAISEKQKARRKKRKKGHGVRGTVAYDDAMIRAKGQAESYARHLPADEVAIAKRFTRTNKDRIAELLETLESLGQARLVEDLYVAV